MTIKDILFFAAPTTLLAGVLGGLGVLVMSEPTPSSTTTNVVEEQVTTPVVSEVVEQRVLSDELACAYSVEETVGTVNQVGFTPLGTVLSFEYDGTESALAHERTHMFQICTRSVYVMSDAYYDELPEFHSAVTAYALRGASLSELRMEHEAWSVANNCTTVWNKTYVDWKNEVINTEDAAAVIRSCVGM